MMIRSEAVLSALLLVAPVAISAPPQPLGKFEMGYPFPAPDGGSLVFQGNFDGRFQLYRMNLPDGAVRRLHVSGADDTHPAFSPDGRFVAFISNRDGNDDVYLLDLGSGAARPVSPHPGKDGHPKWSADGSWLTFNRTFDPADKGGDKDSAIMRVRPDGTDLKVVTDSARVETFPSFSPNGSEIVFIEWFANAAGELNRNGELVIVDVSSGRRRRLTNTEGFEGHPYWGASGLWIYFSAPVQNGAKIEYAVHRAHPDGTRGERLTPLDGVGGFRAVPTADERAIYFNRATGGRTTVHSMAVPQAK